MEEVVVAATVPTNFYNKNKNKNKMKNKMKNKIWAKQKAKPEKELFMSE